MAAIRARSILIPEKARTGDDGFITKGSATHSGAKIGLALRVEPIFRPASVAQSAGVNPHTFSFVPCQVQKMGSTRVTAIYEMGSTLWLSHSSFCQREAARAFRVLGGLPYIAPAPDIFGTLSCIPRLPGRLVGLTASARNLISRIAISPTESTVRSPKSDPT